MLTVKFLHVLFVFMWIGSLLSLTRLLGYLAKETPEVQNRLAHIFRRVYLFVDLPSMILAIGFGITLIFVKKIDFRAAWFHMKMTFAALLIVCDIITGRQIFLVLKRGVKGRGVGYKILHGCTALLLIAILATIYIIKKKFG